MKLSSRVSLALGLAALALFRADLAEAQNSQTTEIRPGDVPGQSAGEERPQPEPLKLPNLPPVPMPVLVAWAAKTKNIGKLDGKVKRVEYDEVFEVEKHSAGKLYYEKPNKGRIDLEGMKFPAGTKGNQYPLAPGDTEEWVCDGQRVFQINRPENEKPQANVFAIPPDQQGENIMNGPLPFLFGMPPETAQKRFWLFLKGQTETSAHIVAYPKLAVNAQSYKYAEIILSKKTFLPMAVKLRSPADNGSVMYVFEDVVQDRRWQLQNPFVVDTKGMHIVNNVAVAAKPPGPPTVPSFVGLHGNDVSRICKELGVKPKYLRGDPAANADLKHRVYKQSPAMNTPIEPGTVIEVTLYDSPKN